MTEQEKCAMCGADPEDYEASRMMNKILRAQTDEEGAIIRRLKAEIEQLRAQLAGQGHALSDRDRRMAELRGVVERLPKTADGVPVVPRMRIWTWGAVTDGSDCGIWHLDVRHVSYGDDYSRFYCTREAAEAAWAGKEGE